DGAPTANNTPGKDGDTYVDQSTGDIYVHDGNGWTNTGKNVKGPKGEDGKSPTVEQVPFTDATGAVIGSTIIIKDGDGQEVSRTNILNGKDGKSPVVEVINNNDGTHTVKVTDPDGNVKETTVKDGKSITSGDGAPTANNTPGKDGDTYVDQST
ncbi:collagen-flanked surface repeat-containing protein, partial [Streptococcus equi]